MSGVDSYYRDDLVTLYLGDCRETLDWTTCDLLCTDPPYGRGWKQGALHRKNKSDDSHKGIEGDETTEMRDWVLNEWGPSRMAAVFGDLMLPPPSGTKQVLVYLKPKDAGRRGATGGFRRDAEAVYLIGKWPSGVSGRSSLLTTGTVMVSGKQGMAARYGHPHAKPVDVMGDLISAASGKPSVADPFAGSGSALIAARNLGLKAVGVEIDEQYAEKAAERLSQPTLFSTVVTENGTIDMLLPLFLHIQYCFRFRNETGFPPRENFYYARRDFFLFIYLKILAYPMAWV